ncbi:hypothetical protein J6S55_00505 [Candidatus Saccharibacteria bacterium]|nr:hypothetical protein [Candidatus Saccharibacteria bacterium]
MAEVMYDLGDEEDIYLNQEENETSQSPREEIYYLARDINNDLDYIKYDQVLKRLEAYRIRLGQDGFYLIGTGNRPYKYSTHNQGVLQAIAFNIHSRSGISMPNAEKAKMLMAIRALAVDLSM